ncbi:hypothetical protein B2J93_3357 [Marssonina coronariae]|uniref:Uncharacterized protein n=1 Tax=Diplocarpon coronariae TaxID=2795749 RepID=A0A218YWY9_9HELO|nr:hypothetical protein B2J93_3357 [Marssonina coronariae]
MSRLEELILGGLPLSSAAPGQPPNIPSSFKQGLTLVWVGDFASKGLEAMVATATPPASSGEPAGSRVPGHQRRADPTGTDDVLGWRGPPPRTGRGQPGGPGACFWRAWDRGIAGSCPFGRRRGGSVGWCLAPSGTAGCRAPAEESPRDCLPWVGGKDPRRWDWRDDFRVSYGEPSSRLRSLKL